MFKKHKTRSSLQIFIQMSLPQWNLPLPHYLKCQHFLPPTPNHSTVPNLLLNTAFIFLQSTYHHLIRQHIFYFFILFIICSPTPPKCKFHAGRDFYLLLLGCCCLTAASSVPSIWQIVYINKHLLNWIVIWIITTPHIVG